MKHSPASYIAKGLREKWPCWYSLFFEQSWNMGLDHQYKETYGNIWKHITIKRVIFFCCFPWSTSNGWGSDFEDGSRTKNLAARRGQTVTVLRAAKESFLHKWVFPKIGVPQNGWSIMENPIKVDDLGVPLFLETTKSWVGTSRFGPCTSINAINSWILGDLLMKYPKMILRKYIPSPIHGL